MKRLDHINIVKIYHIFEDLRNYYIVMEFVETGEVWGWIQNEGVTQP